jgi:hypothetical protein
MSIFFAGNQLNQRKGIFSPSFDIDYLNWYARVLTAGSSISSQNQVTLNKFFVDLKKNNLWNSITQANILCGVSSLSGALIPIKGATPVNNGFVTGDYNIINGLNSGSLNNKWLDTTVLENSFSSNPDSVGRHFFVASSSLTSPTATNKYLLGSATLGGSRIYSPAIGGSLSVQLNAGSTVTGLVPTFGTSAQRIAMSRQNGTLNRYYNGTSTSSANTAGTITTANTIGIFGAPSQSRYETIMQFYSFGYYADLTTLDSVVSSMISAIV